MRSWGHFVGMLGPKFWHIYRREGLVRTLLRAKPYKYSHEKAGWKEVVRQVGSDEFGNKYYEDFDHHNFNNRRWVEFSDYGHWHITGKRIAPGWHGWLHYQYDDPPKKENFVQPYWRSHRQIPFKTDHPTLAYKNPGHVQNPHKKIYDINAKKRVYQYWDPSAKAPKRGKVQELV